MSNIIQELLAEGAVAGFWDGRSGHWDDLGPNGNNGVLSAGSIWEGKAIRLPGLTDEISIADAPSLRLTTGSFVLLGRFNSQTSTEGFITKRNVTTNYQFYASATHFQFYDGTAIRTLAVNIIGSRSIGITFAAGAIPIGYINGLSQGNFSGITNPAATTDPLDLGNVLNNNNLKSPLEAVLICNRILTETEMAQVHDELANLTWPTGLRGFAKNPQLANVDEPGIVAGWDMRPAGGVISDNVGANDGTIVGGPMAEQGILGNRMRFDGVDDHILADSTPIAMSGGTIAVWSRVTALGYVAASNATGGAGCNIRFTGGGVFQYLVGAFTVATGIVPTELHCRHVITWDDTTAYAYINGVLVGSGAHGGGAASTQLTFAALHNETAFCNCSITEPKVLSSLMSPEEIVADYLEGARAIQFKTDWGFQVSPAAEGGVANQVIGTRSSPFRAVDAAFAGVFETDTVNGRLCKVLRCTSRGDIYIPGSLFFDTTPTEAAFGTFRAWMYKADGSALTWKFVGTDLNPAANGYAFVWAADESVVISELGVGNVVAGGSASHSTWHQFDVTHASDGDFDGYIDRVTFGNGNDLTIPTSIGMLWSMDVGDKLCCGNIQGDDGIVKRLGVVAP